MNNAWLPPYMAPLSLVGFAGETTFKSAKNVVIRNGTLVHNDLLVACLRYSPLLTLLPTQTICTNCGQDAHFTQRLVDGKPANHDDAIVCVGAQETYQARKIIKRIE